MAKFIRFRFSAAGGSGFGCQEKEVPNADLPPAEHLTPETFRNLQPVVRKTALRA